MIPYIVVILRIPYIIVIVRMITYIILILLLKPTLFGKNNILLLIKPAVINKDDVVLRLDMTLDANTLSYVKFITYLGIYYLLEKSPRKKIYIRKVSSV